MLEPAPTTLINNGNLTLITLCGRRMTQVRASAWSNRVKQISNISASRCCPATATIETRSSCSSAWLRRQQASQWCTRSLSWKWKTRILALRAGQGRTSAWGTGQLVDILVRSLKIGLHQCFPAPVLAREISTTVSIVSFQLFSKAGLNLNQFQSKTKRERKDMVFFLDVLQWASIMIPQEKL